jgi:hypothetical protein
LQPKDAAFADVLTAVVSRNKSTKRCAIKRFNIVPSATAV